MTIAQELQKPVTSPYIRMIEIDGRFLNPALHFCFTSSSDTPFVFDNLTWEPFPVEVTGIEITAEQPNRPKLKLSNITRVVQPYLIQYQDLANVKVVIRQTLEKYLADMPEADNSQQLPKQVYYIKKMNSHSIDYLEFELTKVFDLPGVKLPRAQALKDNVGGHTMWCPGLSNIRSR